MNEKLVRHNLKFNFSPFLPSIFHATFSLSHYLPSSIESSSLSFLSKTLSWWWSFSFHGLFSSGWRLLSPLLIYLLLQLHGWKSPLKDLIEAQRSSLHRSFSSKLPSHNPLSQCNLTSRRWHRTFGSLFFIWSSCFCFVSRA